MSIMTTANVFGRKRIIFRDVDWREYGYFLHMFADRPAVRLTYDRGRLEIMTVSREHGFYARLLCCLITILTQELGLPISPGGSVTLRLRRKLRGLEPDECFWITNTHRLREGKKFSLRRDPPPDLAVEIDITRRSINRMDIYRSLRIPEVWLFDSRSLSFYVLGSDGTYQLVPSSRVFPFLKPKDLLRFLLRKGAMSDMNPVLLDFRSWVRQQTRGTR